MADIHVTCAACGHEATVSEYIDPDLAVCPSCGSQLDIPRIAVTGPRPPPGRKPPPSRSPAIERNTVTAASAVAKRRAGYYRRTKILSWSPGTGTLWILFAVGAAVLALLRFVLLGPADRVWFIEGGLICLAVLHVAVTVDAFTESVMNGILCLVVPFYSLFYLYTLCDSYILRLAVGILIAPFGLDAAARCIAIGKWVIDMLRTHSLPSV